MLTKYRKIYWTDHSKIKMRQYGLSKSKLMQLLQKPERKEQGIVPGTVALMQTKKSYSAPKKVFAVQKTLKIPGEIWLMYKDVKVLAQGGAQVRKIISAWRYPGISKPGEQIPIPEDIRQQLLNDSE